MNDSKNKRFSESRPIRPFRISERGLRDCAFRTRNDIEFTSNDPWNVILEPDELHHPDFQPEVRLVPDVDTLAAETELAPEHLDLSIILRDPALWRSERLESWKLLESPRSYAIPTGVIGRFSGARGLEVWLQVCPAYKLEARFRIASNPGQIVAARSYRISVPTDGAEFPVETVAAEYFEELGLPKETVWIIDWKTTIDFDRPAEEVLLVLINREVGEKLLRMSGSDSVGKVLWTEIAAEIFVEICLTVFGSAPEPPTEQDGLLAKVTARLSRVSGASLDDLIARARNAPDGTRFFRGHLQAALDLGQQISRINLAGRSS